LGAGLGGGYEGEAVTSALPKPGHKGQTHAHQKEIVSAMVKMNTQGLQVPLGPEDLNAYLTCGRKLPNIPQTGVPMKKKHLTDLGPGNKNHYQSLMLDSVDEESDQRPCQVQCLTLDDTESRQDDSTTVFDLVHRGR